MLIIVVAVALFFDFTNGFHDTANAVATTVATKALPPKIAIAGAAVLNFIGAFLSLQVAATIATGIVHADVITLPIVLAALAGATIWNLITWFFGLPTSSSHALIGGVVGAAVVGVGSVGVINLSGIVDDVLVPSVAAPFIGAGLAIILVLIIKRFVLARLHKNRSEKVMLRLQLASGGLVALTHGTNDAQKTMGIITLALLIVHPATGFHVPVWVILASATAMGLGTYTGGRRIINTLGSKITHLTPHQGFAAELSTACILWTTAHAGFPISTTQAVSSSILGVGAAENYKSVHWSIIKQIALAWVLTLPAAAIIGGIVCFIALLPGGFTIVTVLVIAAAVGISALHMQRHHKLDPVQYTFQTIAGLPDRIRALFS